MLSIKAPPADSFKSARHFAAWLGLTPKDHSTGGRVRLGGITKAGDPGIRSTLIVGATALLRHVRKGRTRPSPWLAALLERKPPKLVAVALANKFARIAWRLMVSGGVYNRPPHRCRRRWRLEGSIPGGERQESCQGGSVIELAGTSRWSDRSIGTRDPPKVTDLDARSARSSSTSRKLSLKRR